MWTSKTIHPKQTIRNLKTNWLQLFTSINTSLQILLIEFVYNISDLDFILP